MADTDVTEPIQNTFICQDAVGRNEVGDGRCDWILFRHARLLHSASMWAASMTFFQRSRSAAMYLRASSTEPPSTVVSALLKRCLTSGSARISLTAWFSLVRISAGVFGGAARI